MNLTFYPSSAKTARWPTTISIFSSSIFTRSRNTGSRSQPPKMDANGRARLFPYDEYGCATVAAGFIPPFSGPTTISQLHGSPIRSSFGRLSRWKNPARASYFAWQDPSSIMPRRGLFGQMFYAALNRWRSGSTPATATRPALIRLALDYVPKSSRHLRRAFRYANWFGEGMDYLTMPREAFFEKHGRRTSPNAPQNLVSR